MGDAGANPTSSRDARAQAPCFHCSEPAALSARICPHCRQSLLEDVVLRQPVRDPRAAYALARTVSRLGLAAGSVVELKRALGQPRARLAVGLTRDRARQLVEACREGGAAAEVEPHRGGRKAAGGGPLASIPLSPLTLGAGGLAVVLVTFGLGLWLAPSRGGSQATEPELATDTDTDTDAGSLRLTTAQIAETRGASTVSLSCGNRIGSGFFVAPEQLVTNAHVLCPSEPSVEVHFPGGRQITGRVARRDTRLDLALVEVPFANAEPLPLGDASLLEPGDKVVIIGTPHGMDHTVHEGIVSHVGRNMFGVAYVQVDANVNPGNSGGPLFNEGGELVGIVTLKAEGASGIGFALPINYVYDAPTALVSARPSSPSWQDMLARARQQELEERDRAATAFSKPALLSAMLRGTDLVLVILKRSSSHPGRRRLRIAFEMGGRELCSDTIEIAQWQTLEDAIREQPTSELSSDIRWLREQDLSDDLWYGAGYLQTGHRGRDRSACAGYNLGGAEAVGEDTEEGYDRVTVTTLAR